MIKILHCADLHLDSPMSARDISRAEAGRNDVRAALTSLIMYIKSNSVDFLLISGDLFDGAFVSRETVALLCHEFASIPDCRVIIAPGNHDPYTFASYYRLAQLPENVFVFDSAQVKFFDFPDKNTTVYGWAFTSDALDVCPIDEEFSVMSPSRINLLVAHGELDATESKYCPISSKVLAKCGFDYIALGHRHAHDGVKECGEGYIAYSGCLEGRGFDELGVKGAIAAAIDKNSTPKIASKFLRFCKRRYEIASCDVTGAASNADVLDKISALIRDGHYGDDTVLRVRLVGAVDAECKPSVAFLEGQFPSVYSIEIIDATTPPDKGERLKDDPTLRGEFYRSLESMLTSDDESERELASMALKYGLAALSGSDISDV